jgi:hypothetical protein
MFIIISDIEDFYSVAGESVLSDAAQGANVELPVVRDSWNYSG